MIKIKSGGRVTMLGLFSDLLEEYEGISAAMVEKAMASGLDKEDAQRVVARFAELGIGGEEDGR